MTARVAAIGLLVACASAAADLRGYDKLGPLDLGFGGHRECKRVESFVYSHWQQRKRGYVVFTIHTIEGEPTTEELYVEPGPSARWRVRGHSHSIYSDLRMVDDPQKQPDRHVTRDFDAVALEWMRDRGVKYLALKDASGKIVDSLCQ
jgi:hypothetical protein